MENSFKTVFFLKNNASTRPLGKKKLPFGK